MRAAVLGQDSASRPRPRTQVHHRGLELEGGCYAGARMAQRWRRAKVKWEMSAKMTEVYAELDREQAIEIGKLVG